jgi:molybdenum-dependent DNA-binding transcriptional regulator ModE
VKDRSWLMAALALPCQELQYIAEIGSGDEPARKIYASYQQFRTLITDWSDISERAVLNSRVA